jgi:hypothetical protein
MTKFDCLYFAKVHKNTHGQPLKIVKGNYLYDLYTTYWNKNVCIVKSTQSGVSEWLFITEKAFAKNGLNQFHMMPTDMIKNRFIDERIDRSISNDKMFKKFASNGVDNKSLKQWFGSMIAFVGSNSAASMTSFPSDVLTIDELDHCDENNVIMAYDRLANSKHKIIRKVGNPTHEGVGISFEYSMSNKGYWFIKHDCGKWIRPNMFDHICNESGELYDTIKDNPRMICNQCGKPFHRDSQGLWVFENNSRSTYGFQISHLFSANMSVKEIHERYERALLNESEKQHFYNNVLGLPFTSSGSKITKSMLDDCIDIEYELQDSSSTPTYIGIDPGRRIHYVILRKNMDIKRLDFVDFGYVTSTKELMSLIDRYNCRIGIIDAAPELQLVTELLTKYPYFGRARYYIDRVKIGRSIDRSQKLIQVNRRYEMDLIREKVIMKTYRLPKNAETIKESELYKHLQAPIRVYDKDKDDYNWVEGNFRDDLYHALLYATIATEVG